MLRLMWEARRRPTKPFETWRQRHTRDARRIFHTQCKAVSVATLALRRRFTFVGRSLRAFGAEIYSQTKRSECERTTTDRVRQGTDEMQGHRCPTSCASMQLASIRHAILVSLALDGVEARSAES